MLRDLIHVSIPDSIIGVDAINKLEEIIAKFGAKKILVVTDIGIIKAGIVDKITGKLKKIKLNYDIYDQCKSEPTFTSIEALGNKVREGGYDLIVGLGGGSVLDATKIASQLALKQGMSVRDLLTKRNADQAVTKVLIPTTAGTGSEWSSVAVVYDDKADKDESPMRVYVSEHNLANSVVIDPELALNLPQRVTAETGMDALTHAIEAFTSPEANIISDMLVRTAIGLISSNLRLAYSEGTSNLEARYNMAIAASIAMNAAVITGLGLIHAISKPLAHKARMSHGMSCAVMLPYVMSFNMIANPPKFAQIAEMMGEDIQGLSTMEAAQKAVEAVTSLAIDVGIIPGLKESKLTEQDIDSMIQCIHPHMGPPVNMHNPREVTPEETRRLLISAIKGTNCL